MSEEVKLPKQVEENAALAEQILSGEASPEQADAIDNEETEAEETTEDSDTSEATDQDAADDDEEENEEESGDEDDQEEKVDYEQKYKTLKGKYDKEVPTLSNDVRALKDQVFSFLESQQGKPDADENIQAEIDSTNEEIKELEATLVETLGEDVASTVRSLIDLKSKEVASEIVKPVQKEVTSAKEDQFATKQEDMFKVIDSEVDADWRTLMAGEDQEFIDFLGTKGKDGIFTYGEMLAKANGDWDPKAVSKVLNEYLGTEAAEVDEPAPKVPKKKNIAPKRSTKTTPPQGEEKIQWTASSLAQFKKDDREGKLSDEESTRLWEDLLAAPSEGRYNA
jgi:hypothetical protein